MAPNHTHLLALSFCERGVWPYMVWLNSLRGPHEDKIRRPAVLQSYLELGQRVGKLSSVKLYDWGPGFLLAVSNIVRRKHSRF